MNTNEDLENYISRKNVKNRIIGCGTAGCRILDMLAENGVGDVDLPEQRHITGGYWFTIHEAAVEHLRTIGRWRFDPSGSRGPNWRAQSERARARDGHRCRLCGAPERPDRKHDVHHIRPFRTFGHMPGDNDAHREANRLDNLITLCKACHRQAERALGLHGALTGMGHALRHIAPLFLMCDPRDLGVIAESHAPWTGHPTVTIYERAAAGVGFGGALFELHEHVLEACAQMVRDCPCEAGCPSCVGPTDGGSSDAKAHAAAVLRALLG